MTEKPTYEELEQRVNALEKEFLERKQAGESLLESEERYRSLLEASPDPVVVYDIELGQKGCIFHLQIHHETTFVT